MEGYESTQEIEKDEETPKNTMNKDEESVTPKSALKTPRSVTQSQKERKAKEDADIEAFIKAHIMDDEEEEGDGVEPSAQESNEDNLNLSERVKNILSRPALKSVSKMASSSTPASKKGETSGAAPMFDKMPHSKKSTKASTKQPKGTPPTDERSVSPDQGDSGEEKEANLEEDSPNLEIDEEKSSKKPTVKSRKQPVHSSPRVAALMKTAPTSKDSRSSPKDKSV